MKNLITGGAGFIGSHLAEYLLQRGEEVVVVDDLSTGSVTNLRHLHGDRRLSVVIDTVLNRTLLDSLVAAADRVFHLAAAVGVELIVKQPARVIETNVLGTEAVLSICARYNTPVFIASTSEVYGKSEAIPFREDDDIVLGCTTKTRWAYACSKAIDEFLALAHFSGTGLPTVVGRFFNTAGPRQTGQYGMVIPRFIGQALANAPITVYGDGTQIRCFTHVADVVAAVATLIETPAAFGQVINIGTREQVSINDLAAHVIRMTGSSSTVQHVPFQKVYAEGFEDIAVRVPDIAKLERLIGYVPRNDLRAILRDTIASKRETVASLS